MELVRYKPGEAIRWLGMGAGEIRKSAQKKTQSVVRREGERNLKKDVQDVAGALIGMGKGALADLMQSQAQSTEYVLHEDRFEVVSPSRIRAVKYGSVKSIRMKGDRATLVLSQGSITIKPQAYILSGRIRVPVGWSRNGLEVPYEVLLDELAGRCDVEIEQAA